MAEFFGVPVPPQALAFLGVISGILVLLVVFFLYINKKVCFSNVGGFPCIEQKVKKTTSSSSKLGSAYAYEDGETSSDSDDEVLRRYQQTIHKAPTPNQRTLKSQRSNSFKQNGVVDDSQVSLAEKGNISRDRNPEQALRDTAVRCTVAESIPPAHDEEQHLIDSSIRRGMESNNAAEENRTVAVIEGAAAREAEVEGHVIEQQYSNEGFQPEDMSPEHCSATSSEHEFGDNASISVGEVDEHLFDVSDLQYREPALISKCGTLEMTFTYSPAKAKMIVKVGSAKDIPTKERGGASNVQVRLLLLPTKKVRHKTKIKPGEAPDFEETFTFRVPPGEVNSMGLRARLYGTERMRRERMIGEAVVGFASVNQDTETTHWLTLEPRSNLSGGDSKLDLSSLSRSDSASSTQSMQHGGMPELLVGLTYNGTTGRLSVEIVKGSNFRNMAMNRAPDTYVKLTLMSPSGQEIARSKTSIRRGQPNPLYKETFMFQVALFQLPDVTLMISVYNKRSMKRKEMIGWFSLGLNNSGEEELGHWNDMRESKGEPVCRWHVLLES